MAYRCDECGAVLNPAKLLRCTRCKACFYCSAACQKRNWRRLHKRVCTTDPALQGFVRVEMAVERALAKQPPMEEAPKDATCYICLEGDDGGKSSKLLRGCACRGDSAGFVHLECLTKLAKSKDETDDLNAWKKCMNCKQGFLGALELELLRRSWWHRRSSSDREVRYSSMQSLADRLTSNNESDAATYLYEEASKAIGDNAYARLELQVTRAKALEKNDQKLEALNLLNAVLPEAKEFTEGYPDLYFKIIIAKAGLFGSLNRNQEAHETALHAVAFAKAKYGPEGINTLVATNIYALVCVKMGRVDESRAMYEDLLVTETRILGRDHPFTQTTRENLEALPESDY